MAATATATRPNTTAKPQADCVWQNVRASSDFTFEWSGVDPARNAHMNSPFETAPFVFGSRTFVLGLYFVERDKTLCMRCRCPDPIGPSPPVLVLTMQLWSHRANAMSEPFKLYYDMGAEQQAYVALMPFDEVVDEANDCLTMKVHARMYGPHIDESASASTSTSKLPSTVSNRVYTCWRVCVEWVCDFVYFVFFIGVWIVVLLTVVAAFTLAIKSLVESSPNRR